ncbi:MAG: HAD family hydrolase [Burkholderiaceae bacterium]
MSAATAPIRAISLDLDDTLWPMMPTLQAAGRNWPTGLASEPPRTATLMATGERARIRKALQALTRTGLMTWAGCVARCCSTRWRSPARTRHWPTRPTGFHAARQQVRLYPDVRVVLSRWARDYRLIAISNGNADLDMIGLGGLFHVKQSAALAGMPKPDPRIFALACEQAGVSAAQTLHIGDDWHLDVCAARACGMRAAWICRPDLKVKGPGDGAPDEAPFADLESIEQALRAGHFDPARPACDQ